MLSLGNSTKQNSGRSPNRSTEVAPKVRLTYHNRPLKSIVCLCKHVREVMFVQGGSLVLDEVPREIRISVFIGRV